MMRSVTILLDAAARCRRGRSETAERVFLGGVSVDSWTPGPKPLCHRHPTGPHPSGLLWTPVDSRHADSTMSDFALAALFQPGHERLEPRRPLGGVQAGGRMAELAVDLEVVGGDAGLLELGHH